MTRQASPSSAASSSRARVMMAVPQYPYPVVGGLERQAHELAKALVELGVDVQAISGRIDSGQPAREWVEGVLVHRIPWSSRKWRRFVESPFALMWVLWRRRSTYDVLHLHQFSWFGLFSIVAARLLGRPVLTKLPSAGEFGLRALAASRLGAVKLAIIKRTDAVVAMSRESLAELEEVGFPRGRVLCTPNGIRMQDAARGSNEAPSNTGVRRVGFVGRLSEEKRVPDLLHAWQQVVASGTGPLELELWGAGPLEGECRELCRELGIADSVRLRGHVESVRDRLGELDVFVLPSAIEGNSNAILEAMAAGLPIVSTRVGGTPMLVGVEGAPFLVAPGDRQGLASRLLELVEDAARRRELGETMRRRILAHFEITGVARAYAAAYVLLAKGRREQIGELSNPVITGS